MTPKRKAGRPREADTRQKMLAFRVNFDEFSLMERAAEKDRRPLAQWMRDRLVLAAESEVRE